MPSKNKNSTAENNFQSLCNLVADPVVIIDKTGKLLAANLAVKQDLGFDPNEVIGKNIHHLEFIDKENKIIIAENFEKRMKGFDIDPYEIKIFSKDGKTKYFETRGKRVEYSGNYVNLVVFHDITDRKSIQKQLEANLESNRQELTQSEEKLTRILESSPDPIAVSDSNSKIIDCNSATLSTFGYSKKIEVIGKSVFEFFAEKERPKAMKNLIQKQEGVKNVEYTFLTKNGWEFPGVLSSSPVYDFSGKVTCFVSTIKDISELKKTENDLREARERYSSLFERAPLGILIIDPETSKLVEFNDVAHQQLNYSREEFSKLFISDFEAIETREIIRSHLNKMLKEGGAEFETKHHTKDGQIRDVLVTTKTIELSGKIFLQSIFHDITETKKVQDALMKSESQYRQLVELAQEGVWALDKSFQTIFVNPRMAQMLGYSEGEMIGKNLFEFIDRKVVERARNFLLQFKQGVKGQFEYMFPRKDGTYVYTSIATSNITDDQGQFIGTLALVADITERKQAEEALRKSEERARAIVANSPIGIATSSNDKRFLSVNAAFCKMLGYTEDELKNLTFKDITHPNDIQESVVKMKELEAGRISSFTQEKRYVKKNGNLINVKTMVSAIRDQAGKPTLFIAELEDITERKKKELELKEERNKLEAMTQNIGAGFVVISKDYHVQWANKFIHDYKGDVDGKLCYATLNDLNHVCPDCGVKKVFEKGVDSDSHEYCSTDIKGNPYCVQLIATPIKDEAGNVISAVEIAVDITEKKNMQDKLSQYSQKLERLVEERTKQLEETQLRLIKSERLAAIGELAGMVGHDLRNPLTGIKNAVYYLKKKLAMFPEDQVKAMLEIIEKGIDHSDKIIGDLLDYSREMHLELQMYSVQKVLEDALTNLKFSEKIKVNYNIPDKAKFRIDENKIERVFINLIKNAIDAMPNGGTITINCKQTKSNIELSFADTGAGIPEEVLPKLFVPLFTTKAQGMGFGLAICKRIVDAHGGTIKVETAKGKGTTFKVTLPIEHKLEIGGEKVWINMPESLLSTTTKT